ncbi:uncharacterized [Tachysurus ichikawai]
MRVEKQISSSLRRPASPSRRPRNSDSRSSSISPAGKNATEASYPHYSLDLLSPLEFSTSTSDEKLYSLIPSFFF